MYCTSTRSHFILIAFFFSRLDQTSEDSESYEAIRNLVLLVASLSFCGHTELKQTTSSSSSTLYELDSFVRPEPENKGSTVRNLQAFQVLQSTFLKSESEQLSSTILDAISTIYTADNANYFLLEPQSTLSQFAERIWKKPVKAQEKYFQLIEFLVHHLKFVPCKELIAISLLLKAQKDLPCCVIAVQTLQSVLRFDDVFKNVFREIGMLEVFVTLLQSYADYLKSFVLANSENQPTTEMVDLGENVIKILGELLGGGGAGNENAVVFRKLGGAVAVLSLIKLEDSRYSALGLMQQLVLTGSEEDMTALLELLHTSTSLRTTKPNLDMKADILHVVIACLRESHRTRAVFRRVGGFIYIISVLVSLEGSLADRDVEKERKVFALLRGVFTCLTTGMRYEPANAKYFRVEMNCGSSMVETIKLLGCFSNEDRPQLLPACKRPKAECRKAFQEIFTIDVTTEDLKRVVDSRPVPQRMVSACLVFRMLYDMAVDNYDKTRSSSASQLRQQPPQPPSETSQTPPTDSAKKKRIPPLNLTPIPPDPVVVHAGIVTTMLKLLPLMHYEDEAELSVAFQLYAAEVIKSLLRTEKNQQIMCEVEMLSDIFAYCKLALEDEAHVLHEPFQYLLERLAAQKLEPRDLVSQLLAR